MNLKKYLTNVKQILSEETPKKYGMVFALVVVAALILELFVFNFKWVNSAFDKELDVNPVMSSGFSASGDKYRVSEDTAEIEFKDLNEEIKYLYFKPGEDEENKAEITVWAVDEANEEGLSAPTRTVLTSVKASQYIRLHFIGEVSELKITINGLNNKTIDLSDIGLNVHVPLIFSWARFIFMIILGMLAYIFRPSSALYKHKTDLSVPWQKWCAVGLLIVQAVMLWNIMNWNPVNINKYKDDGTQRQYYKLTEAIRGGHFYLNEEPPDKLNDMENPYDVGARNKYNIRYNWDHAFYNGKYYVYFGIGPVILLYLPYNLITGNDLPNYIVLYIFIVLFIAGIMLLLWEVIKKWFKHTPFLIYALLSVVFSAIAGVSYTVNRPHFYYIPIAAALMCATFGLAFWLSAKREVNNGGETKTILVPWRLAVGSACAAFTALCRPQFLLIVFFGIMLFWDCAFKERKLFSKASKRQTLAVCLPFVIIAAFTMWYNAARFGSPFDFGANYNLTTNDMTKRGWVWGRTGLGIFTYLLQPPKIDSSFPFLNTYKVQTTYQGITIYEDLWGGGALMLFPILFIGIFGALKKKIFKDKMIYRFVCFSVIAALVISVVDTQMSGIVVNRYFADFVWLFMIASATTVFALYEKYHGKKLFVNGLTKTVTILSAVSLIMFFLLIFVPQWDSVKAYNPTLYYSVQHMIAFWI